MEHDFSDVDHVQAELVSVFGKEHMFANKNVSCVVLGYIMAEWGIHVAERLSWTMFTMIYSSFRDTTVVIFIHSSACVPKSNP